MYIHNVNLDVNAQPDANAKPCLRLSQNENGRVLMMRIIGVDIPEGSTANFAGLKPDGNVYSKPGTVDGNVVSIEEDIQMTAVSGSWNAKIAIVNDGNTICTARIRVVVDASLVPGDAIPSDSQLDGIVAECQAYAESAKSAAYGSPLTANTAADMTDQNRVYVYTGSETGYTAGHWYYYDGSAWTDGGVYNAVAVQTDTTLTQAGKAADAKETGDQISELKSGLTSLQADTSALDAVINGVTVKNFTEGKYIIANSVTYSIGDDENTCVSEVIPLTWSWGASDYGRFYYNGTGSEPTYFYKLIFLDSNQNYLGNKAMDGATYRRVPGINGAAFVQFAFRKGTVGKLTDGTGETVYWSAQDVTDQTGIVQKIGDLSELETAEKDSLVKAVNEVKSSIPDIDTIIPITPENTTFFHVSKNMIDPSTCVSGEYVNQATGSFATNSAQTRTDYIEVNPSTEYVVRANSGAVTSNFRYVFYTAEKTYISGAVGALPNMLLTCPANAKYIIVSDTGNMALHMIAPYINGDKSFEAFGNDYIEPKYIVDGSADDIILNVPSKIYALVGYETNVYFENITENHDLYTWDVTCTKGMQLERGYRIVPSASDVGTYTLTIRASINADIYKEVSTTLIVTSASAGSGETVSIIVLGDSTTDNGIAVTKLHTNLDEDVMSVTTLGTRGTAPNNHEGRSGWSWDTYFTKASVTYTDGRGTIYNPFYNPTSQTFDAGYYFANSGIAIPDVFVINMGINDVFGYTSDLELSAAMPTILARAESAVQSILDATTTTKVCICLTIPPNHSQDAFGKAYACNQTRNRCKRNNTLWVDALIEQFKDRENERIYIIPINACLDTIYNMGMETLPVNARNTSVTYQSPILNGGVHPAESGYWQIADVYTAFLKAQA